MSKPPAFQFYADDFLGGVADMTQAEVGAYILLLCRQWSSGEIPTDPARASLIAKGEVTPHVLAKFPGGKNARLEAVRAEQAAYRAKQASAGAQGAQKRWGRHSDPNGVAIATPMAKAWPEDSSPSPSPTPSPTLTPTSNEEAGSATPTGQQAVKAKRAKTPHQTDAEWVADLAKISAYSHINIPAEWQKMEVWARTRNVTPSRRRFVNWLNNVPAPMRLSGTGRTAAESARVAELLDYQPGL